MRSKRKKGEQMDPKKYFAKYDSRLRFEAVLKSLLPGLTIGLTAVFVMATVCWFCDFGAGLWISLALLVVASVAMTVFFYYKKFKPTAESNARRIDRYGLEERLITMVEYDGDDSYIATAQREDAKRELAKFEANTIKFKFSTKIIIVCSIAAVFGLGMTTVTGLCGAGIIPSGMEVLDALIPDPPPVYYSVEYSVDDEECGFILGDTSQDILKGESTKLVVAFANDGYVFKAWSDGNTSPARIDEGVETALEFEAIFIPLDDSGADETEDEEEADDVPETDGGAGPGGNGDPSSGGASGKYESFNQIINGETFYKEVIKDYQEAIEEALKENDEGMTEEQKEIIKNYIGIV